MSVKAWFNDKDDLEIIDSFGVRATILEKDVIDYCLQVEKSVLEAVAQDVKQLTGLLL